MKWRIYKGEGRLRSLNDSDNNIIKGDAIYPIKDNKKKVES